MNIFTQTTIRIYLATIRQRRLFTGTRFDGVGLRNGDCVDEQPNTAFGNDICNRVADLNHDNGAATCNAKHGENVHNRIPKEKEKRKAIKIVSKSIQQYSPRFFICLTTYVHQEMTVASWA